MRLNLPFFLVTFIMFIEFFCYVKTTYLSPSRAPFEGKKKKKETESEDILVIG
jgi:hypothetical protein